MKDISDIIGKNILLDVGYKDIEIITVGHETVEELRSISKSGKKVTVGYKDNPVVIVSLKAESSPGRKTADVQLVLQGVKP